MLAISSIHGDGIAKLGQRTVDTLNSGVGDLALLEGTSHVPLLASALQNAFGKKHSLYKTRETPADIEVIGEVNAEVREVVVTFWQNFLDANF